MGLDQYAYSKQNPEDEDNVDLAYWRKHNRLQGWMENLWLEKGGTGEFNCSPLELTIADIDRLQQDMENKMLPETEGFFFGGDSYEDYEDYYKKEDEAFIVAARKALAEGLHVYYDCWW